MGGTRGFLPALEGMRACAAVGVVVTHVAFQTGHTGGIAGRLFGRFDLVMLLLALAAIVLWKHAENIERLLAGTEPRIGRRGAADAQDADAGVLQDG